MNRDYAIPGYVAIALAVLFPIYWLSGLFAGPERSLIEVFRADVMRLSAIDALFVLIGAMEIYLFLSLRRMLSEQLNGGLAASLALCMAVAVGLVTATVLFDVFLAMSPGMSPELVDRVVIMAGVTLLVFSILVGLIGLILAITLLVRSVESGALLKLFAVVLLVCSLLALTIILAPVVYVLYPVALLLLAAWFLRGGGEVEVV